MSRFCTTIFLAALIGGLGVASTQAQSKRVTDEYYLRFGQGVSDFAGDAGPGAGIADFYDTDKFTESDNLQYVLVTELGYEFSPTFSLGLGYQLGTYYLGEPYFDGRTEVRNTFQLLARYTLNSENWTVAPYLDLGVNASLGRKLGYGPSVGGDLTLL